MAHPTYFVTTGPRETIGEIESTLLARGFNRIPSGCSSGLPEPKQYRLWNLESGIDVPPPCGMRTLLWREEPPSDRDSYLWREEACSERGSLDHRHGQA